MNSTLAFQRLEFQTPQMGVPFRIVLFARNPAKAEAAAAKVFERVSSLNRIFSDYEYDSELSRLSRSSGSGTAVHLSPELAEILTTSQRLARQTDGAFDVTVGPATALWRRARREHELPRRDLLELVRSRVGYRNLVLDPEAQTAKLILPHMRLDLGGIAKGYALDEAGRVLRRLGLPRFLVSAGGDLLTGMPPPDRPGWVVTLEPENPASPSPGRYLLVNRRALATSGDRFQFVDLGGRRYSHIIDPRTCLALTRHTETNVIAEAGRTADSLSTSLNVLAPNAGIELVQHYRDTEARIEVGSKPEDFATFCSPGFCHFFLPSTPSFVRPEKSSDPAETGQGR